MKCKKFRSICLTFFLTCFLFSCKKNKRDEFYQNGNLKNSFYVDNNNKIQGIYRSFYEDGNIKELHNYKNGIRIDSSLIFYDLPDNILKTKYIYNDSLVSAIHYDPKGNIIQKGELFKGERIGKWKFKLSKYDSVVEYVPLKNLSYVNQIWLIDKESRDTIPNRGNYYELRHNDTTSVGENMRIKMYLKESFYNKNTSVFMVIPKLENKLNKDFSNWDSIEKDTILNLKNDGIPHPELPNTYPTNHVIEFALQHSKPGMKKLSGVLVEYTESPISVNENDVVERRLYFETEYYVKEVSQ